MDARSLKRHKLIALFFLGFVLLNGPLLLLFNNSTVAGVPALFIYIFLVWGGLIAMTALIIEKRDSSQRDLPKD